MESKRRLAPLSLIHVSSVLRHPSADGDSTLAPLPAPAEGHRRASVLAHFDARDHALGDAGHRLSRGHNRCTRSVSVGLVFPRRARACGGRRGDVAQLFVRSAARQRLPDLVASGHGRSGARDARPCRWGGRLKRDRSRAARRTGRPARCSGGDVPPASAVRVATALGGRVGRAVVRGAGDAGARAPLERGPAGIMHAA